jgi:hypothetical protein
MWCLEWCQRNDSIERLDRERQRPERQLFARRQFIFESLNIGTRILHRRGRQHVRIAVRLRHFGSNRFNLRY